MHVCIRPDNRKNSLSLSTYLLLTSTSRFAKGSSRITVVSSRPVSSLVSLKPACSQDVSLHKPICFQLATLLMCHSLLPHRHVVQALRSAEAVLVLLQQHDSRRRLWRSSRFCHRQDGRHARLLGLALDLHPRGCADLCRGFTVLFHNTGFPRRGEVAHGGGESVCQGEAEGRSGEECGG